MSSTEKITSALPDNVVSERVVVRTRYTGQALRVSLVCDPGPFVNWEHERPTEDQVTAELVIAPGHRLIVESGGVRVEHIERNPKPTRTPHPADTPTPAPADTGKMIPVGNVQDKDHRLNIDQAIYNMQREADDHQVHIHYGPDTVYHVWVIRTGRRDEATGTWLADALSALYRKLEP